MRYRAVISYFGARYVGWQRQLNGLSVQEVFEKALEKTFGTKTAGNRKRSHGRRRSRRGTSRAFRRRHFDPRRQDSFCRQHASSGRREHAFLRSRIRRISTRVSMQNARLIATKRISRNIAVPCSNPRTNISSCPSISTKSKRRAKS